ncbi:hypothetical protein JOB18_046089 [Solea senegalensis]|uniref:Uncharacterized protein n=1 Tax=Solea senegalensis TaxID=28829 RepID=A0AAV6TCK8_SOLSE|nr:hypothetical protein JOB18_046089 [Solea senegalensis]
MGALSSSCYDLVSLSDGLDAGYGADVMVADVGRKLVNQFQCFVLNDLKTLKLEIGLGGFWQFEVQLYFLDDDWFFVFLLVGDLWQEKECSENSWIGSSLFPLIPLMFICKKVQSVMSGDVDALIFQFFFNLCFSDIDVDAFNDQ